MDNSRDYPRLAFDSVAEAARWFATTKASEDADMSCALHHVAALVRAAALASDTGAPRASGQIIAGLLFDAASYLSARSMGDDEGASVALRHAKAGRALLGMVEAGQ